MNLAEPKSIGLGVSFWFRWLFIALIGASGVWYWQLRRIESGLSERCRELERIWDRYLQEEAERDRLTPMQNESNLQAGQAKRFIHTFLENTNSAEELQALSSPMIVAHRHRLLDTQVSEHSLILPAGEHQLLIEATASNYVINGFRPNLTHRSSLPIKSGGHRLKIINQPDETFTLILSHADGSLTENVQLPFYGFHGNVLAPNGGKLDLVEFANTISFDDLTASDLVWGAERMTKPMKIASCRWVEGSRSVDIAISIETDTMPRIKPNGIETYIKARSHLPGKLLSSGRGWFEYTPDLED